MKNKNETNHRGGPLPMNAPLAMSYTPMQPSVQPAYEPMEALSRGTLFPGLDLPFMNTVNREPEPSPETELMAIDFVLDELQLYLDTHSDDREAFALYQSFLALRKEAHERYVQKNAPVSHRDMLGMSGYSWVSAPWPWQYGREG